MPGTSRRAQLNLASINGAMFEALAAIYAESQRPAGIIRTASQESTLGWCQHFFYRMGLEDWPSQAPSLDVINGIRKIITLRRTRRAEINNAGSAAAAKISDKSLLNDLLADAEMRSAISYLGDAFSYKSASGADVKLNIGSLSVATITSLSRPLLECAGDLPAAVSVMQQILQQEALQQARVRGEAAPVYDSVGLVFKPDLSRNEYEAATSALVENDIEHSAIAEPVLASAHAPVIYEALPPVGAVAGVHPLADVANNAQL